MSLELEMALTRLNNDCENAKHGHNHRDLLREIKYLREKISYFESVTTGSVHKRIEELTKHLKINK